MFSKANKRFVSEIDQYLSEVRELVPELASQQQERKQYETLDKLRDNVIDVQQDDDIWSDF